MATSEPESSRSFPPVWHPFAPRQQTPRASLSDLKESFDRAVQGFWSALKRGACNSPISCIPLLTRRSDHFSLLNRTSSWPRWASPRREPLSTKVQPGSSSADLHRSRSLFIDLPGEDKPLWLDTYDTQREAAQAYYQAKSVIDSPKVLPPFMEDDLLIAAMDHAILLHNYNTRREAAQACYEAKSVIDSPKVLPPFMEDHLRMVARQDAKKTFPLGASYPRRRTHKKTRDWTLRRAKKRRLISPEKSRASECLQCPSQIRSRSSLGDAWRETTLTVKEAKLEIPFAEEHETSWEELSDMLSKGESKQQPKKRGWEKAGKDAEFEMPFAEELEPWSLQILKGKSKQQPKERVTHYRSSRSWEGDSPCSGSEDEVSSADTSASDYECRITPQASPSDKEHFNLLPMFPGDNDFHFEDGHLNLLSEDWDRANILYQCPDRGNELFSVTLGPGPKFCDTFTSTEGVPDLPTHTRPIRVAGGKNNKGDVELLFEDVGNMLEVVGVGLEWAKLVVTKELGVEVRHIGEYAWKDLWANLKMPGQVYGGFELMNIICSELQILDQRPSNIVLEDLTERFGVGLTSMDVVSAYVEDHVEQSNDQEFFPHVLDLAKYMGLEGKNVVKSSSVSSGEIKSLKRTVGGNYSNEKSGGNKDPPQDPSEDPPLDPPQDPSEAPAQDAPSDPQQDPSEDPPLDPLQDLPPDPPQDPSETPPPDPPGDPSETPPPDPPGDPSQNPSPDPPGDPSQDPPSGPPQDPPSDPPEDPSQDPPNPLQPSEMEGRKVLVVIIYPELGYLHEGSHGQVVHEGHPLHKASIAPILQFEFQVNGKDKKITTTLRTECNLGEDGGPHLNPPDLGYFQDDITISLTCKKDRAALLSSARVENIVDVRRTITNIKSSSSTRECSGQMAGPLLNLIGVQGEGSYGGTKEKSDSSAIEISTKQLSSFHVGQKKIPGSLVFNFVYPEEVEGRIADAHHGPRELITLGIGETFESTIIGQWDKFYQDPRDPTCRKCPYSFKIKRHITSIGDLRQSHGIGQEPQCIQQWYEVPLWVNHAMTHILHRHKITKLEAPGVKTLEHVIEANPASVGST